MGNINTGKEIIIHPLAVRMPRRPDKYGVILLNDDYTPFEFVEGLLIRHFQKTADQANLMAWQIHTHGRVMAGVFPREVAEEKVHQVEGLARSNGHPLLGRLERA